MVDAGRLIEKGKTFALGLSLEELTGGICG
jgi:hypothetical protein